MRDCIFAFKAHPMISLCRLCKVSVVSSTNVLGILQFICETHVLHLDHLSLTNTLEITMFGLITPNLFSICGNENRTKSEGVCGILRPLRAIEFNAKEKYLFPRCFPVKRIRTVPTIKSEVLLELGELDLIFLRLGDGCVG